MLAIEVVITVIIFLVVIPFIKLKIQEYRMIKDLDNLITKWVEEEDSL